MKKNKILIIFLFTVNFHATHCHDRNWLGDLWNYVINHFATPIENDLKTPFINKYNSTNPYRTVQAVVRTGSSLPIEEKNVINKRLILNKSAQEKLLGQNLQDKQTLKIAFCASGGGYRAMICTLGSLIGAQEIGLLDCILYTSSLSGSTWLIGPWTQLQTDLNSIKQIISKNLQTNDKIGNKGLLLPHFNEADQIDEVINNCVTKLVFDQKITSVDLWGALIINNLLCPMDNRQLLKMSQQHETIKNGSWPFPIYTAIEPTGNALYEWFEFTPYEVGSTYLNAYIPTWSFGRKFENGRSVGFKTINAIEHAPEKPFGFFLGIFGSAYTVNLEDLYKMMDLENKIIQKLKPIPESAIKELLNVIDDKRFIPAEIPNFTYNMTNSSIKNQQNLTFVDAGIDFNLPFPPLLRTERQIDVIFAFDASDPIGNADGLKGAQDYAKAHGLKFPNIDYTNIDKKSISIFSDEDPQIPMVIYMPKIKDNSLPEINNNKLLKNFDPNNCDYCSTFNFAYSQQEFDQLCELTRFNLVQNKEKIKNALLYAINIRK